MAQSDPPTSFERQPGISRKLRYIQHGVRDPCRAPDHESNRRLGSTGVLLPFLFRETPLTTIDQFSFWFRPRRRVSSIVKKTTVPTYQGAGNPYPLNRNANPVTAPVIATRVIFAEVRVIIVSPDRFVLVSHFWMARLRYPLPVHPHTQPLGLCYR